MFKYKIGFIGGGNMGSAIAERLVDADMLKSSEVLICDKSRERLQYFSDGNYAVSENVEDVITDCQIVFIAVKPQMFDGLKPKMYGKVCSEVVISIMAGKKKSSVKEVIGQDSCPVVRIMPNLASRYGAGVTLADMSEVSVNVKEYLTQLFNALGLLVEIDEKDFNFCSSISGCGPAFFFEYFKYFYQECVKYGLPCDDARSLVLQTAYGSAKLAMNSPDSFETLISNVCSKGGSTIEGVKVIEGSDMAQIVSDTVSASKNRNDELELAK